MIHVSREGYVSILTGFHVSVGHFDETFKSRVQLALHYPPLDTKGPPQIRDNFIKMLDRQQSSERKPGLLVNETILTEQLRDKIEVLARENLNERQIRNSITTARQLAQFRGQTASWLHAPLPNHSNRE
jgi:hypothetical protein